MDKSLKKLFGQRVKYYRNLKGLSQENLAERVGISANTIGYIERGKNAISFSKIPALSASFDVKPYQLFIDTNTNSSDKTIEQIETLLKTANERQLNIFLNIISSILDI